MIRLFSNHKWVAAVFAVVTTVGWTVQGVGNAYYYREVRCSQVLDVRWCAMLTA